MRLLNAEFMFHHRAVPVGISEGTVRIAMCDPFDLRTMDAVERITGLRPVPYLALEDEFENFLETLLPPSESEPLPGANSQAGSRVESVK